jgi:hypothetical protein
LKQLEVAIPDKTYFCTLYAEGIHCWKNYDREKKVTVLHYPPGAAVFLYYTYPTHREACVVRNDDAEGGIMLPGLAKKVSCVLRVHASKVDKLRRAAFYLNRHSSAGAYGHDDGFYVRLGCLMEQRGKISYPALRGLFESSPKENQNSLF